MAAVAAVSAVVTAIPPSVIEPIGPIHQRGATVRQNPSVASALRPDSGPGRERIKVRLVLVRTCLECVVFCPVFLPFRLDFSMIVNTHVFLPLL